MAEKFKMRAELGLPIVSIVLPFGGLPVRILNVKLDQPKNAYSLHCTSFWGLPVEILKIKIGSTQKKELQRGLEAVSCFCCVALSPTKTGGEVQRPTARVS